MSKRQLKHAAGKIATTTLLYVALSGPAVAQDVTGDAASWEGPYGGAHIGVGSVEADGIFDSSALLDRRPEDSTLGRFFDVEGGLAGIHIGYNISIDQIVFGIEGDWTSFDQSDRVFDAEDEGANGEETDNASLDIDWLASIRTRIGIASARTLIYATIGAAWVEAEYTARNRDSDVSTGTADLSSWGVVVGGGLEHALSQDISLRLEALYYSFDNRENTSSLTTDSDVNDFAKIEDIILARIGVTYHLNGVSGGENTLPISIWNGVYAGAHLGYAHTEFSSVFDSSEIRDNALDIEDSVLGRFFDLDDTVAGVHVGVNRIVSGALIGLEFDWSSLEISDTLTDPDLSSSGNNDFASVDLDWMASIRTRIGIVSAQTLFYATIGAAWIEADYRAVDGVTGGANTSLDNWGVVYGAGIEHALTQDLHLRLEALRYEFDERVNTANLTTDSDPGDFAELGDMTVFRIGMSYFINTGGE